MKILEKLFSGRRLPRPFCSALIAAAGSSSRMEGENKLMMPLGGKPVLVHTLLAFERAPEINEIIISARECDLPVFADLCKEWGISKPVKIVVGGQTRTESVYRAALEADSGGELLAVHDGARPFVTPELIAGVVEAAQIRRAAAPAVPVKDTIKMAEDGIVTQTPDRKRLFAVQTPQVFDAQLLRAALHSAIEAKVELTDDCSAVERLGKQVYLTAGLEDNIKITTPLDMILAQAILDDRES